VKERLKRVNESIRERVAKQLAEEVSDPELGLITVTAVEITPDLRNADVWVSVMSENPARSMELIEEARPKVQQAVNKTLTMKFSPRLHFKLDRSAEKVERLNELLSNKKQK